MSRFITIVRESFIALAYCATVAGFFYMSAAPAIA